MQLSDGLEILGECFLAMESPSIKPELISQNPGNVAISVMAKCLIVFFLICSWSSFYIIKPVCSEVNRFQECRVS